MSRRRLTSCAPALALMAIGAALVAAGCAGSSPRLSLVEADASVRAAAANAVTVSPLPDTEDASASTQISFLGPRGTHVVSIRVTGSRSGAHIGSLRRYSTGTGESFLPARPFLAGERVLVRARVRLAGRERSVRTSFAIARQAQFSEKEFPLDAGDRGAVQRYASTPALDPSAVTITTPPRAGASPGDLFLAPYQGYGAAGPMIVDQRGRLVWFRPLPAGMQAANLGVQRYRGRPVLVWWQGRVLELGFGVGEDVVFDSSYRQVASVRAGNGYRADLHTIRLTPQGTAWIDAYDPVQMNLKSAGGAAEGVLNDSVIQEIDLGTGLVMWEWHALGHIPFGESKNPAPGSSYPWDFVHVNSVVPGDHGDILVSFRNTWSADDVDVHSGGMRWRLGGVRSSFALTAAERFYWQHDAAFGPHGEVSLFDNGSDPPMEHQSRGLVLALDPRARRATLREQLLDRAKALLASSQGSAQRLDGGNWLIGYGGLPNFTEFSPAGRVLFDGTLGKGVQSFTTRLFRWTGTPLTAPAVAVLPSAGAAAGEETVAVSWNGATAVAGWRVLSGATPRRLAPIADASPTTGFETRISFRPRGPYVVVEALDAAGSVLGATGPLRR